MLCLSEQGLYFFLGRSDKEAALPYQKMIAGEVMPSIRKTGQYKPAGSKRSQDEITARAVAISFRQLFPHVSGHVASAVKGDALDVPVDEGKGIAAGKAG